MEKTRASSTVINHKIIAGEHLNPNGTLFGGYLMSWMDEVAFMRARRFTGRPTCVTVNIDNITFRTPIRLGEHIVLTAIINHVGQRSMEIEVSVACEDPLTHELKHTNNAHLTFVCLDEKMKALRVPTLILESGEDYLRNRESRLRIRIRRRFNGFLLKRKISAERDAQNESKRIRWFKDTVAYRLNRLASRVGFSVTRSTNALGG